jgi:hypothetical protein
MDRIVLKAKRERSKIDLRGYELGSIITFFDTKTKLPAGKSECNQVGILIEENKILYCRKKYGQKVMEIDVNKIKATKMFLYALQDKELSLKITNYFKINRKDYRRVKAGVSAIVSQRINFFDYPVIFPKLTKWHSAGEYERSWGNLIGQLQPADVVCTFDEKSMISRLISFIDKGPWSHTAMYMGNGEISEAIFCGLVKRKIHVYKNKHIHVGIYRKLDASADDIKDILGRARSMLAIGFKYNYKGVILLGIKKIFGIHSELPSPNDFVCLQGHSLIYYV